MTLRNWDSEIARKEMRRLTQPNVLGFYTHFEATEVFASPAGQQGPINVFSIRELRTLKQADDERHEKIAAAFIVAQMCDSNNGLWSLLPGEIGENVDLLGYFPFEPSQNRYLMMKYNMTWPLNAQSAPSAADK
jgi:hypothetical protein